MPANPVLRSYPRYVFALALMLAGLFLWVWPVQAADLAQANQIKVLSNSARVRYRQGVTFQVNATAANTAKLKVKYGTRGREYNYDVPMENGLGSYTVRDETDALTTGMPLIYTWTLSDGKTQLQTSSQTVVYEDTGHVWRQREGDHLTIRWYDGDDKYGDLMYRLGADALGTYKRRFNMDPTDQIYITIYGSGQDYHRAFPEAPAWSGGLTRYGGVEIIVIAPQNQDSSVFIGEGIPHELSHAAVYQFLGGMAPRWLDEGFAVYNQNTISIKEYDDLLKDAYRTNSLIPLAQIDTKWPAESDSARLAYAEGRSIVTFLINTYGNAAWSNLLDQLRRQDIDRALETCFGVNLSQMENLWERKVLAGDSTVKMPAALKTGPVASQPTQDDIKAKLAAAQGLPVKTGGDNDWLIWPVLLAGLGVVAGLVVWLSRRYRRMNSLYYEVPAHRAKQEEAYLASRLNQPASNLPSVTTQTAAPLYVPNMPLPIPPLPGASVPASSFNPPVPVWSPAPAPVQPAAASTSPANHDDPFDMIISRFNPGPTPPAPKPATPAPNPTTASFLDLDPYGLNFGNQPRNKE